MLSPMILRLKNWKFIIFSLVLYGFSQSSAPFVPPPDKDIFIGTWKANRDQSVPALSDKAATYVREMARDGRDLILSSSEKKHGRRKFRIRCDGVLHRIPPGSMSCLYKAPNSMEGETISTGRKPEYWKRELSSDGNVMTITAYRNPERTEIISTWILDRVK